MASDQQPERLRQALAIAIVSRRRDAKWRQRAEELEREVQLLRRSPGTSDPLQLLAALQAGPGVPSAPPEQRPDYTELSNAVLWQQAGMVVAAEQQQFLVTLQRYLLCKAQVEQPVGNWVLLVLTRTPLQGTLELISDLLDAHAAGAQACPAAAAAAAGAGTDAATGPQAMSPGAALAQPPLVPGHGCALEQAADCLAALGSNPDQLLGPSDSIILHHFCCYLLDLACRPPQSSALQPGSSLPTPQQQGRQQAGEFQGRAAADAPINISLTTASVARQLIARLLGSASVGLMLLRAAAAAVRQRVLQLVAAVTGEQVVAAPDSPAAGSKGLGLSQPGNEALDEDGLVHSVTQLAALLHTALQLLAAWGAELGGCDDDFMRSLYQDIVDAKDACALISVTHSGIARQMQRAAVQVQAALQQMAADAAERGYVYP